MKGFLSVRAGPHSSPLMNCSLILLFFILYSHYKVFVYACFYSERHRTTPPLAAILAFTYNHLEPFVLDFLLYPEWSMSKFEAMVYFLK
ncbi:hypothetical protein AB205_0122970 [Aquarana catesbeiana]|uniref:Uncharacterized protein n=1 Tax=Aquarana catesbeiana TaxID=8400 RepID=A0A2G9NC29_AQUCT|nr:hypothetical protein AB205_0122970 [Aquarana catesbeiana]